MNDLRGAGVDVSRAGAAGAMATHSDSSTEASLPWHHREPCAYPHTGTQSPHVYGLHEPVPFLVIACACGSSEWMHAAERRGVSF
jgi:hypothetical protein